MTQWSRAGWLACLLIGVLFSLVIYRPAFAHGGVDHNNNCFLDVGGIRLRISGYQFQPELEGKAAAPNLHPVGKHFCHFFPELGQIVLAVEPLAAVREKTLIVLELAAWPVLNPLAFAVIERQPERLLAENPASISQVIGERGIYQLNVTLQDEAGIRRQQSLVFLVGVPVTKILVMIAGVLVLLLGFAAFKDFNKQSG